MAQIVQAPMVLAWCISLKLCRTSCERARQNGDPVQIMYLILGYLGILGVIVIVVQVGGKCMFIGYWDP